MQTVSLTLPRLALLLALPLLAACGAKPKAEEPPPRVPGYEEVQDAEFLIPAVDSQYLLPENIKTEVAYNGPDAPGTSSTSSKVKPVMISMDATFWCGRRLPQISGRHTRFVWWRPM